MSKINPNESAKTRIAKAMMKCCYDSMRLVLDRPQKARLVSLYILSSFNFITKTVK